MGDHIPDSAQIKARLFELLSRSDTTSLLQIVLTAQTAVSINIQANEMLSSFNGHF